MARDYQFTGFAAEFWDLLRSAGTEWDDSDFFAAIVARYGQPVLEVGCGTGRLMLALLERGWDVDGIDISPEMLDICEEKADRLGVTIDVYEQAMEDLDLPREYATIIVPASAFQLIVDEEKARRAMRRFAEHLRPGGVLVMPFVWLWRADPVGTPPTAPPDDWTATTEVTRGDGAVIRRRSKSWFDLTHRLEHRQDLYEVVVAGEVVASELHERSPSARGYTQKDVVALYADAGFQHVEFLDPFTMESLDADRPLYVAVGQTA